MFGDLQVQNITVILRGEGCALSLAHVSDFCLAEKLYKWSFNLQDILLPNLLQKKESFFSTDTKEMFILHSQRNVKDKY